jgi:hypothetical protein
MNKNMLTICVFTVSLFRGAVLTMSGVQALMKNWSPENANQINQATFSKRDFFFFFFFFFLSCNCLFTPAVVVVGRVGAKANNLRDLCGGDEG